MTSSSSSVTSAANRSFSFEGHRRTKRFNADTKSTGDKFAVLCDWMLVGGAWAVNFVSHWLSAKGRFTSTSFFPTRIPTRGRAVQTSVVRTQEPRNVRKEVRKSTNTPSLWL